MQKKNSLRGRWSRNGAQSSARCRFLTIIQISNKLTPITVHRVVKVFYPAQENELLPAQHLAQSTEHFSLLNAAVQLPPSVRIGSSNEARLLRMEWQTGNTLIFLRWRRQMNNNPTQLKGRDRPRGVGYHPNRIEAGRPHFISRLK